MALPEMLFSTQPSRTSMRIGRSHSMIARAMPSTVAAPPMSFFIRNMPSAGLMS